MPFSLPSLAPSEPKYRFLERLQLNASTEVGTYSLMKAEAEQAWTRLQSDRRSLLLHLREQSNVQPPFAFGQINEDHILGEVRQVLKDAAPLTRPYYELAHDSQHVNWIIRWHIWHVFRDRDRRSKSQHDISDEPTGQQDLSSAVLLVAAIDEDRADTNSLVPDGEVVKGEGNTEMKHALLSASPVAQSQGEGLFVRHSVDVEVRPNGGRQGSGSEQHVEGAQVIPSRSHTHLPFDPVKDQ